MRKGEKLELARKLRQKQTSAERLLWSNLRGRKEGIPRIRRQHPIGPYVVDFAVVSLKIIIEVDGWTHETEEGAVKDKVRTAFLVSEGWRVLRYWNEDVFEHLDYVADKILEAIRTNDIDNGIIPH